MLHLSHSQFLGGIWGRGIYVAGGATAYIDNIVSAGNMHGVHGDGGSVYIEIRDSLIDANHSHGVITSAATIEIRDSTISNHNFEDWATAVKAQKWNGTIHVYDSVLSGNQIGVATSQSGNLVTLTDTTIIDTLRFGVFADGDPGAVDTNQIVLTKVDISGTLLGTAPGNGRGIHAQDNAEVTVLNSRIFDNKFGVWSYGTAIVNIINSPVFDNTVLNYREEAGGQIILDFFDACTTTSGFDNQNCQD